MVLQVIPGTLLGCEKKKEKIDHLNKLYNPYCSVNTLLWLVIINLKSGMPSYSIFMFSIVVLCSIVLNKHTGLAVQQIILRGHWHSLLSHWMYGFILFF